MFRICKRLVASYQLQWTANFAKATKGAKKATPTKKRSPQKMKKKVSAEPKIIDPKIEPKMELCLKLLAPTEIPSSISIYGQEELDAAKERAKEYSRRKIRQHREWQADMSAKERLTRAAIFSLPPHLRVEAVKEDTTPIPMRLPFPTDTPPHEWH